MTKEARIYSGVKTLSSINGVGKTRYMHKKMKLDHRLTTYIRINSKWIKDLTLKPETLKLLDGKMDSKVSDSGFLGYVSLGKGNKVKK